MTAGIPIQTAAHLEQWHLESLKIDQAHQISTGVGITVAVLDSGVDSHRDLQPALLPGISLLDGAATSGQSDEQGHGTAIAGLIAASGGTDGASGIAPGSKILPIKILDAQGRGSTDNTAKGIRWATSHGAKIINISTASGPNIEVRKAIEEAIAADVVIVASSGNKPTHNVIAFPAYIDSVVAVGATGRDGAIADISTSGEKLDLAAPGVDLLSTWTGQTYQPGTGTSASAAIVSGVAALVWSRYPELSAAEVVHRMTATAVDKGAPGRDPEYGFGIVDPVAALTANVPPLETEPAAEPTATAQAAPVPNTMGRTAVILIAVIGSLIGVALVIALAVARPRNRAEP
ncbi:type VII secretion-associated serine protease mycosin [Catenuloplanes atrovinosus]|uniref:Type VII secretion-associated serine protease mycosin n=1 Tax=Catenuloplanes atrovinosus TaxID=137266 RepID=A0AAE4CDS2_9ACTN|nr:type VII secretion-associated serine protease mycosin [Catenuloplanes atrovinosus]MDR7280767.1 type VII secretion-associated serine protease mycosin [Catenuloplanes atrovinosus]